MTSDRRNNEDRRRGKLPKLTPGLRLALLIVLGVVAALAILFAALYSTWVVKPELPVPELSASPSASEGLGLDAIQPKVSGERKSKDFYTILIFGEDVASELTDTIMLVSYDVTNQRATVMSFPRDTLINSSAKSVQGKMINAVYKQNGGGEKGIQALKNEVSELVGFMPDYYIMINWELVGQMVDAIGGVWYDVPYHMDYDDPYQDLYIHFEPGNQYLTGEDAMKVVRWRKNNQWSPYRNEGVGSDLNRIGAVQHSFLKAVLEQTLQLKNVTKIGQLSTLFSENVVSDLSVENLFWFGAQAIFSGLDADSVNFTTMPCHGTVNDSKVTYYGRVYPDEPQLLELINEHLNPFVEEVTVRQLDLIRISADGNTLSSSTGVLADPSAGASRPRATATPRPTASDPVSSNPVSSEPEEPDPVDSGPVATVAPEPPADQTKLPIVGGGEGTTGAVE